jgi:hypothetical protein
MAQKSSRVAIVGLLIVFLAAVGVKIIRQIQTPGVTGEWVAQNGSMVLRIERAKRILSLVDYKEGRLVKMMDNAYRVESFPPYSGCKYRRESDKLILTISGKTELEPSLRSSNLF